MKTKKGGILLMKTVQYSFKRYEEKYMLTLAQQKALLEKMSEYMEPDIYGETTNCNIYYDKDNWELIRKSIEKPVYKEKLRVRSYGIPKTGDNVFIEIKKKYEGIVYKRRTTLPCECFENYLAGNKNLSPDNQIGREIEYFQNFYKAKPKVYIAYDRTSYIGKDNKELRITFDRNLRFREYALDLRKGDFGERMIDMDTVLMEIKIPNAAPLWLAHILSSINAKPTSFSKYGTYYKTYVLGNERKEIKRYA